MSSEGGRRIKTLLVEDHPVIRAGLAAILEKVDDIEIAGVAVDGKEGVGRAQELKPDVILMDVGMPVMDGIEAARRIRANDDTAKIIMLTARDSERDIFASLSAGANGYCLKEAAPERLCTAIRAVFAGDLWLDSTIASKVLSALPPRQADAQDSGRTVALKPTGPDDRTYGTLSQRELEVLQLLVEGLSNSEMAERLIISRETVKTHVRHIMEKLAVNDRIQAAVKALRHGLV